MTIAYNQTDSKEIRRLLRRNQPAPESIIWSRLRNRQLCNSKWKRQYSIGRYVVDFYCPEKKLAIEIDGESHFNKKAILRDKCREEYVNSFQIRFLRFNNDEVMRNIEGVMVEIDHYLTQPLLVKERSR